VEAAEVVAVVVRSTTLGVFENLLVEAVEVV
jgi:hypothetical protein